MWYPQHYDSQLDRPPCHQLDGSAKFRETLLAPAVSVLRLKVVPQDEVVRLDLSQLPDEEAETILDVLGKDSVFRAEEKGRIE